MKSLCFILLSLFAGSAFAQAIRPGIWHAETSVKLNGISLPGSENEECIPKAKARDLKATISKDLKDKGCELTAWKVKKKKLEASLRCKTDDIEADGQLAGDVTDKMYDLTGEASGKWKSIPASVSLHLVGKWISKCPK